MKILKGFCQFVKINNNCLSFNENTFQIIETEISEYTENKQGFACKWYLCGSCLEKYRNESIEWVKSIRVQDADYKKEYRKENKKTALDYQRKYYKKNKEKIVERAKKYCERNKELIRATKLSYYEKNKEKITAAAKAYREKKRDEMKRYMVEYNRERSKKRKLNYSEAQEVG